MKYILLFTLILASCKKEPKLNEVQNKKPRQINLVEFSEKENLADYIQKINVVKLKTEYKLVGIDKVVYYHGDYYTLDKKTSQLIVFDSNGNYLRKIGERGNGPGEYKKIRDFEIDRKNQQILILSAYNKALYKFTLAGKFITRIVFDFYVNQGFVITDNDTYVFMHGFSSDTFRVLTRTNTEGEIINNSIPFPKNTPVKSFSYTGGLHKQGKSNYFTGATSSLIYEVQDHITPLYQFNFGKDTWKEEDRYELNKFIKAGNKFNISFLDNFYCDTDKVLAFKFSKGKNFRKGFYFKETNKVLAVPFNLEDSFLYRFLHIPIGIKDNQFISSIDYSFYQRMMISEEASEFKESYSEYHDNLNNELEEFSEYDNPYLLIYEIKDNK